MIGKNTLIILAGSLIVILGLSGYILYSRNKPQATTTQTQTTDSQSAKLGQQSNSDDINSIEKDLNNTDLNNLDKESTSIQTEINSTQ